MLEVRVINDVREVPNVQVGQVRKNKFYQYHALVICKGGRDFPIVIDAELTITDKEDD